MTMHRSHVGQFTTTLVPHQPLARAAIRVGRLSVAVFVCMLLGACATKPLMPYSADTPPLVLVPAPYAGIHDQRARFREIFCAVLEARARDIPDYQPCDEALTRVGAEPAGTGRTVPLGPSSRRLVAAVVPGVGYDCIAPWLEAPGTVAAHVRQYAYDQIMIPVDALSSSQHNARQLRDAILAMPQEAGAPCLVLIGYSKGAPDILEALVAFPELRSRVAAVVTAAGAVGGSALANEAEQNQANLLRHFPKATCGAGDGGAVESLRPGTRQAWLAAHALPREVPFYSLVAYPQPDRISWILKSSYHQLSRIDARNDSQVIFYDQVVPGGTLLGYLNADHWAVVVPFAHTHATLASVLVTHNAYPREALLEAILRFVEEDLGSQEQPAENVR
jgi:hypothetical protein